MFNWSEVHFYRSTFYKIHTLVQDSKFQEQDLKAKRQQVEDENVYWSWWQGRTDEWWQLILTSFRKQESSKPIRFHQAGFHKILKMTDFQLGQASPCSWWRLWLPICVLEKILNKIFRFFYLNFPKYFEISNLHCWSSTAWVLQDPRILESTCLI